MPFSTFFSLAKYLFDPCIVLLLSSLIHSASSLNCNYCAYALDIRDCFLNHVTCGPEYACVAETQTTRYRNTGSDRVKTVTAYKMGCKHFSLCRDRLTYGYGAYGYSKIVFTCCCGDLCGEPDGMGRGKREPCPVEDVGHVANGCGRMKMFYAAICLVVFAKIM